MATGKYIIIEGGDGTGKTTQAELLQAHLESRGINVLHIKEPGGSPMGEAIRDALLNGTLERTPMTNILLFTANRHVLWELTIKPALNAGTWVICTRNYWSTLAYQGYGEGMDVDQITAITKQFTDEQYMKPDLSVILTHYDNAVRKQRIQQRGALTNPDTFESRDDDFQTKIQAAYPAIAKDLGIPTVDAARSIADVQANIKKLFQL